jgi:hypothetical protein
MNINHVRIRKPHGKSRKTLGSGGVPGQILCVGTLEWPFSNSNLIYIYKALAGYMKRISC